VLSSSRAFARKFNISVAWPNSTRALSHLPPDHPNHTRDHHRHRHYRGQANAAKEIVVTAAAAAAAATQVAPGGRRRCCLSLARARNCCSSHRRRRPSDGSRKNWRHGSALLRTEYLFCDPGSLCVEVDNAVREKKRGFRMLQQRTLASGTKAECDV